MCLSSYETSLKFQKGGIPPAPCATSLKSLRPPTSQPIPWVYLGYKCFLLRLWAHIGEKTFLTRKGHNVMVTIVIDRKPQKTLSALFRETAFTSSVAGAVHIQGGHAAHGIDFRSLCPSSPMAPRPSRRAHQ